MNKSISLVILLILVSCKSEKSFDSKSLILTDKIEATRDTSYLTTVNDQELLLNRSIEISPDYFQISNSAFEVFKKDHSQWFIDSNGTTRLYLIPATDYSITTAILTNEEIRDPKLIRLLQSEGIRFNDHTKGIKIGNIKSYKGIKIGLPLKEIVSQIGTPHYEDKGKSQKKMTWNSTMLQHKVDPEIGGLIPFIFDGLAFETEMTFTEDDRLASVIYRYELP